MEALAETCQRRHSLFLDRERGRLPCPRPAPAPAALGDGIVAAQASNGSRRRFTRAWRTQRRCSRDRRGARLRVVALGGGTFQNARLLESIVARLRAAGLRVLTARALPPNDGAISYGQAAVAAARLAQEHS